MDNKIQLAPVEVVTNDNDFKNDSDISITGSEQEVKLILIITLAMAILSLALVINAVNAYGQGEGEQKFIDRINQAKEASKEIKKNLDKLFGNVQNEPEVLAKRDKYNQTYYDCFNTGDAFLLALMGDINGTLHDQILEECHFYYNETGVWVC